jgi:hypothetical protein
MSEPVYTITITESERAALGRALGTLTTKLINAPIFVEAPSGGTQQARAVLSPPPPTPPPAAAAPVSPGDEPRDRWASDRRIKSPYGAAEFWAKQGCTGVEVNLCKAENKPGDRPYLRITWELATARGLAHANCFDQELWSWLIARIGRKTRLYLLESKDGKYVNVVGVRA